MKTMRRKLVRTESGWGLPLRATELEALGATEGDAVFVRVAAAEGNQPARIIIRRAITHQEAVDETLAQYEGAFQKLAEDD